MAGDSEASNIRVAVRCRPFSAREQSEGEAKNALACANNAVQVLESTRMPKSFTYDHVFGCSDSQEAIFEAIGLHLLDNAMNAYNGCIFAYGQTGSGKSHSIMGDVHNEAEQGILPRACTRLFSRIQEARQEESGFEATVLASYLEIYNEKIYDLLTGGDAGELQVRNHPDLGPIVPHLTECPVESFEEAHELLDFGAKRRAVGATQMNATSSRSHAVFTLQVRMVTSRPGGHIESQAKVHFVDLAGSERQKKTGAAGERLKEGIGINLSLTTLGRVISELTKPGTRSVPAFRESKLTLLLKDALMGNSRTELLACISPSLFNLEETVSTLEFAARCKLVKTSAVKNEQSKTDVIQRLTDEKAVIEDQLRQERLQREELSRQLQALEEKQKAAERALEVAPLNADVWHKAAIVRCMRFLQVPATREKMDESERKQVDDSLDPPTSLIIAAAGVYAGTYASFRRVLRARPLLLQLVACTPSAVTLCMGGLFISQRLLKDLMKQNGPISVELRTRCSELIPEPNGKAVE